MYSRALLLTSTRASPADARVALHTSALSCAVGRARAGEARLEASNNAREYSADAARLQLASVRVLDVQPWSGPRRGATVVGVRAAGAPARGVRCAFGEAPVGGAWAGWRGGAGLADGAGRAASVVGVRCVSPASAVTGWVGVQLGGPAGLASSGGSFYYHGSLAVAGLSKPAGRACTRAAGQAALTILWTARAARIRARSLGGSLTLSPKDAYVSC